MAAQARNHRIGNFFVAAQFSLIGLCVLPIGPTLGAGQWRPLGLVCLILALLIGGLALLALGADTRVHPVPDDDASLHTHGIYAFIRHPMYAAVLMACLGVTLSSGRLLSIVSLVVLTGVLHAKSRFEDRLLAAKHGGEFAVYAARVPAIVPQPWRSHGR